ncbi:MAG: SOS response-associated peptidase [Nostocaceae cyanobacterium]|nr:SOS response-associated peptidase [Nostocaceae cyanobacterium]
MCGRFTLTKSGWAIAQAFNLEEVPQIEPQYNIAPTQQIAAILYNSESQNRQFQELRWGLIPSWAKDKSIGYKLINARAETVAEKPSFRSAFKQRRCLIVADGFYEWQKQENHKHQKQPYYFRVADGQPFAFAGLWEKWQSPDGEEITSGTILTTEANELMQSIHERMPVILNTQDYDLWLDPQVKTFQELQPVLHPYPAESMTSYPVSTLVNSPKKNSPECVNSQ